ncbi:MAG TPA: hypothetical protein PKC45_14755 [Gemmatales bacterium]|nr:hypothetical protein [Gemmatales bacterium]
MKRMLTLGCRLLAIYFGTLALTVFLADSLRGKRAWAWEPLPEPSVTATTIEPPPRVTPCDPCQVIYQSIITIAGAIECAHGPKYDTQNCPTDWASRPASQYCAERNGGLPWQSNPEKTCWCFKCGLSAACENEIIDLIAFCGWETPTKQGSCATGWRAAPGTKIRWVAPAEIPGSPPPACTYDSPVVQTKKYCGIPGHSPVMYACVSNNGCKRVKEPVWRVQVVDFEPYCTEHPNAPPPALPSYIDPTRTQPLNP